MVSLKNLTRLIKLSFLYKFFNANILYYFNKYLRYKWIIKTWIAWRLMLSKNTYSIVIPRMEIVNSSAGLRTKWDCEPIWILCVLTTPVGGMGIRYFFPRSCRTGVFQNLSIRIAWVITSCDDKHPQNETKIIPKLAEMRAR